MNDISMHNHGLILFPPQYNSSSSGDVRLHASAMTAASSAEDGSSQTRSASMSLGNKLNIAWATSSLISREEANARAVAVMRARLECVIYHTYPWNPEAPELHATDVRNVVQERTVGAPQQ